MSRDLAPSTPALLLADAARNLRRCISEDYAALERARGLVAEVEDELGQHLIKLARYERVLAMAEAADSVV